MKAIEWSQHLSHMSMNIFPDAKGQLTPKSWFPLAKFQSHLKYYGVSRYLQE